MITGKLKFFLSCSKQQNTKSCALEQAIMPQVPNILEHFPIPPEPNS